MSLAGRANSAAVIQWTEAKVQNCFACGAAVRNATVHVVGRCVEFTSLRANFVNSSGKYAHLTPDRLALSLLGCRTNDTGFTAALEMAECIDARAADYWLVRGYDTGRS